MKRLRQRFAIGTVLLTVVALSHGCWLIASERSECDRTLDVICGCDSQPCNLENPPEIVTAMRRCNEADVRPDGVDYNVHLCIQGADNGFCAVIDGMLREDGSLCNARCDDACSPPMIRACESYQHHRCDLPPGSDAGGAGGSGG